MITKPKATQRSKPVRKPKSAVKSSARRALSVGTNVQRTTKERVAALVGAPLAVCDSDDNLQAFLAILRNPEEPLKVRLAALQSLQAASFSVVAFEACRADYIATLREIAEDPDLELRQRVLGILAREKDGFVQKKLLEGLQDPDKALLSPEKALQLLSYDVHAEAYPIARAIVSRPPNAEAKREALRLLAADASAAPMFEKMLRDKKEAPEIRQISAAALQATKPEKLRTHAREILLDASEPDSIQATSLTALTQFGDEADVAKDQKLIKRVEGLSGKASTNVKKSARRFLSKYRR